MSTPSDREYLATAFNLFTSLHRAVSGGKIGVMQVAIYRDQIVQTLSALAVVPPEVAQARDRLEHTLAASITSELLEQLEGLIFGPIAAEIRTTSFRSTLGEERDLTRVLDYLERLKASVRTGDMHQAFAYRVLLVGALDQAGALSISKESRTLLGRASTLLSQAYATADVDFKAAIDAWQQDYAPLQAAADSGVTALQTARTLIANVPLDSLTVERLDEVLGLLDGHIAPEAVHWQ